MNATETQIRSDQLASREILKRTFQNRIRLSETHFALLIQSTLNKRDDQFHGRWQKGHPYRKGDVVFYKGALWELTADTESCGTVSQAPGDGDDWTSRLQKLEDQVGELQAAFEHLCQDFQAYQDLMERRLQWVDVQLTLLIVVLGTLGFAWLAHFLYRIWVGVG